MKRILYIALGLLPFAAAGQNLDPTVEVSRTYEGKLIEVRKPQMDMAVPDSVLRFDLDFDYSVTDTPFKGSYEFSPYSVNMKPSPTVRSRSTFYLQAGAEYQLHPVFDLIWNPRTGKTFNMDVYASHRSFFGNYWQMSGPSSDGGAVEIGRMTKTAGIFGYDMDTKAGIDGRLDWDGGLLKFDAGYIGLHQQDEVVPDFSGRSYNAFRADVGMASKKGLDGGFRYSANLMYRVAEDDMRLVEQGVLTNEFGLDASLGGRLGNGHEMMVELGFDVTSAGGLFSFCGGDMDLVPHYLIEKGRWSIDLGARLSASYTSDKFAGSWKFKGFLIYPDVRIEYRLIKDAMRLYLNVDGDSRLNSYSDLLKFNRHANPFYRIPGMNLMDVTVERVNATIGAEGRIGRRFAYDLSAGYANYADALLEAVMIRTDVGRWAPGLGYAPYQKAFAALDCRYDHENIQLDASFEYNRSWQGAEGNFDGLFLPAAFRGDVACTYNWNRRIFAGIDCRFSSARKCNVARVAGYADLGLNAEYAVNRKFSVWARGGNLLGMTIQRSMLYAEKGPYFTAGICLNL